MGYEASRGWYRRTNQSPLLKEVAKVGNGVKLGDGLGDWNILKSIRHDLKAGNEPVRRCGGWDLAVGVAEFDCVGDDLVFCIHLD